MQRKQSYPGIDVMKFIAAFLVTAIHIPLFRDVDFYLSYYFTATVCRLAVPFFFACAGYFLADKWTDGKAMKRYILRLLKLYSVWTALYLPQIVYQYRKSGLSSWEMAGDFLYRFVITGSYTQFWYFPALLTAVCAIYLLKSKMHIPDRVLIPVIGVLHIVGVMGNSYYGFLIGKVNWITKVYESYFSLFETTRGGIFFGLFYLYMGTSVRGWLQREETGWKRQVVLGGRLLLGLVALFGERAWLLQRTAYTMSDMTFVMAPVVLILLLLGICLRFPESWKKRGVALRNCSTIIFCSHLLIEFYLHKALLVVGAGEVLGHSLFWFGYAYGGALMLAALVLFLSEKKGFRWLKALY